MILHIGCDAFVPLSSIVAVLDARAHPELVEQALSAQESGGSLQRVGTQEVKSIYSVKPSPAAHDR